MAVQSSGHSEPQQIATELGGAASLSVFLSENIPILVVGNVITFLDEINLGERSTLSAYGRLLLCKGDTSLATEIKEHLSLRIDPSQKSLSVCLNFYATEAVTPELDAQKFEAVLRSVQMPEIEAAQLSLLPTEEKNDEVEVTEEVRLISDSIRAALPNKKVIGQVRFECGGEVIGTLRGKITATKKEFMQTLDLGVDALVVDVSTDRRKLEFVYGKKMTASFDINRLTNDATDALKGSVEGRIAHLTLRRSLFSDDTFADEVIAAKLLD